MSQQQLHAPADLPAMPLPGSVPSAPIDTGPLPAAPLTPQPEAPLAEDTARQAQELVERYSQNPHQLAEAFGQFKAGYLAHHYHIVPNAAGK